MKMNDTFDSFDSLYWIKYYKILFSYAYYDYQYIFLIIELYSSIQYTL